MNVGHSGCRLGARRQLALPVPESAPGQRRPPIRPSCSRAAHACGLGQSQPQADDHRFTYVVSTSLQDQLLSRTNSWQEATNSSDEQLDRRSDRWPEAAVAELRERFSLIFNWLWVPFM